MSEQIFISYRRDGGDVTAKLICEAIKNLGFTVFYDYDSINGGYFDARILDAIEGCNDFVLVLPPHSLERCVNEDDWVRQEIRHALKHKKNIIPVMLPGFEFPKDLPEEIADIVRFNGVQFVMAYFDSVMAAIVDRFITFLPFKVAGSTAANEPQHSVGLSYTLTGDNKGYLVSLGDCTDTDIIVPRLYNGKPVVGIAESGFRDYASLISIQLPSSITSIGRSALNGCTSLSEITLPGNLQTIGAWAFGACALTHIYIPKSTCMVEDRAFWRCQMLAYIDVDPENNYICSVDGHLFTKDMKKLISYANGNCQSDYIIPNGVTTIAASAFNSCKHIKFVSIPESVTTIDEYAFDNCINLKSMVLPNGIIELHEGSFSVCTALDNISLPNTLTYIGKWCFYGCAFERITIPASVTCIEPLAFLKCKNLKWIDVDPANSSYCSKDGHLYTKDGKTLLAYAIGCEAESYTVPAGVTHIADSAFSHCGKLRQVSLPESLQNIDEFAFANCSALESIALPNGIVNIPASTFIDCSALQKVTLPKSLTNIDKDAFRNCKALTSITLPDSVVTLADGAFNCCTSLSKITLSNSLTRIGKWTLAENIMRSIVIPKNVVSIEARAFLESLAIEEYKVSFWNRAYRAQNGHLFTKDMTTLVAYALGKTDAAYGIPDGVKVVFDSAFSCALNLRTLTIPGSVESIGEFAFYSCNALTCIHYKGTMQMWSAIHLEKNSFKNAGTAVVHCIDGDVNL